MQFALCFRGKLNTIILRFQNQLCMLENQLYMLHPYVFSVGNIVAIFQIMSFVRLILREKRSRKIESLIFLFFILHAYRCDTPVIIWYSQH